MLQAWGIGVSITADHAKPSPEPSFYGTKALAH